MVRKVATANTHPLRKNYFKASAGQEIGSIWEYNCEQVRTVEIRIPLVGEKFVFQARVGTQIKAQSKSIKDSKASTA